MENRRPPVALVTGGGRRIGAEICRVLAEEGARVVVHCRQSVEAAEALARSLGRGAFVVKGDLSTAAGCRDVFAQAVETAGRVDWLVNNAAIFPRDGGEDPRPLDFRAPRVLLSLLAAQAGVFPLAAVHILDARIAAPPLPPFVAYTRAKRALARSILRDAIAFAPRVRVNGVAPGDVLAPERLHERAAARLLPNAPTPDDVAAAVAFLLEARAVTGQILHVDSGSGIATKTRN